ncbi:hypothetical protein MMARJ_00740 [Mycobacterium marseillense]|uniref:Uncharacterized protein n=1 Tax=Mycobacterium marseillense TaxID=701042 RepID=A0ABM7J6C4_9MYCO|nr:hypothetical protein MMARJ_00740 [Mycobacterium marseillense]
MRDDDVNDWETFEVASLTTDRRGPVLQVGGDRSSCANGTAGATDRRVPAGSLGCVRL